MVNEVNKPPASADNAALSARLADSNRQLQEMQEEHRQLLLEMETLRARAAELTRLNAQRQQLRQATREETLQQSQEVKSSTSSTVTANTSTTRVTSEIAVEENQEKATASVDSIEKTESNSSVADKEETAKYLQEKLNEIANLKAQFKRVQHMVDTTKLLEDHMANKESQQSSTAISQSTSIKSSSSSSKQSIEGGSTSVTNSSPKTTAASATAPDTGSADDNADLLNAMLNMFTDFTSDLRGQAESLRAERERIKTLKEEVMRRNQGK